MNQAKQDEAWLYSPACRQSCIAIDWLDINGWDKFEGLTICKSPYATCPQPLLTFPLNLNYPRVLEAG